MTNTTRFTIQYRDYSRTLSARTLADAIATGLADGEAFDISIDSGAIVWVWEMRS